MKSATFNAAFYGLFLSILCTGAAPAPAMKHILVFGDSLSEGFEVTRTQAYPMLLVGKLRAAGLSYELTNASQT